MAFSEKRITTKGKTMTLKAILFVPGNYGTVIAKIGEPIPAFMLERQEQALLFEETLYFIPGYVSKYGKPFDSAVVARQDYMDEEFSYDKDLIRTQFVEITRL